MSTTPSFTFYLGTHITSFMRKTRVPLFISRRVLATTKKLTSLGPISIDSGGFTELSLYGKWLTPPSIYASQVRHWFDNLDIHWAAVQDWMCEPFILDKTGLSIKEHQYRTIESYLRLKQLQPKIKWVPVIQGYEPCEYLDHIKQYEACNIDLTKLPIVGIGSVCRRQSKDVDKAETIIREVYRANIKLHAFGFKVTGLERCVHMLTSADSMAWSYGARREKIKLPNCTHSGNCANCFTYAVQWRNSLLKKIGVLTI